MISEILQKYIPSKTYITYLNEIGHTFTDFETAAILYNVISDIEERNQVLLQLADTTEDENLKKQIHEKLSRDANEIERFVTPSRNAIYLVEYLDEKYRENEICGYASSFDVALEMGLRTKSKFSISKRAFLHEVPGEKPREKGYFNPYIGKPVGWTIDDDNIQEVIEENAVDSVFDGDRSYNKSFGTLEYNKEGRLIYYWVSEEEPEGMPEEEKLNKARDVIENTYSNKLFYNSFVAMPFPFELGDYVKLADGAEGETESKRDYLVGIVSVSRENYERFLERAKTIYVDYSDAQVTTTFIEKDGSLTHNHIPPILLEKVDIDESEDWFDLAQNARWMIMGEGALDFFTYAYDKYKEKYGKGKRV